MLVASGVVVRPLLGGSWEQLGGFVLCAGVLVVLAVSVSVSARPGR